MGKSDYPIKARDLENYYGVTDFLGFRASSWSVAHKKLSDLIDELEDKAPLFQIRPIRKWDAGSYRSYCGHFHVFKHKQKWRVELEMERSSLMSFDPSESDLESPRPWQTREIDWKSRHGILEGCDTLSELYRLVLKERSR